MASTVINGVNVNWATLKVVLYGITLSRIISVNYERKQVKENLYGAGTKPVLRGRGNVSFTGDIEVYSEEWNDVILASNGLDPLQNPPTDIIVQWETIDGFFKEDVLRSVEFENDPMVSKQGDTSTKLKLTLVIGDIVHIS